MASKLGSLTLDLIARVGDFVGPIQQAENQSNSSFSNMRDHVTKYGSAVVAATGAAVVGLAAMTSEYVDQIAELERMAFRSNTTTQEFQRLAVGAEAFGVEAETLSGQLKDFNEKLGELTTLGSGAGIDFFEQIAMKTEGGAEGAKKLILQMQKLSGPQALQLYIDKLEEAGVSHQQMSFYLESMGGDLTELIPLFINGGEAAKIYGDAADRAGLVMSENTIQQAKILKEQVYLLDLQMQGAKNQLMQAVIPAFVDISEAFFSSSEQGLQFEGVANVVAKTLKGLAAIAMGAVAAFQLVGKTLGGMAAIGSKIYERTDWYEMNPLGLAKSAYEARAEIAALGQEIKIDLGATIESTANRLDKLWNSTASGSAKKLAEVRKLTDGQTKGLDDVVAAKKAEAAAQEKATTATSKANATLKEHKKILDGLGSGYVSNSHLKGLNIKSSEAIAGGQVRGYTAEFAQLSNTALGGMLNRFTAFNDTYHKGTNSKHATGQAFDLTVKDAKQAQQAVAILEQVAKKYGYSVKILDEYAKPSARSTGGHLHVSVLGKKAKQQWQEIQDEVEIVGKGNDEKLQLEQQMRDKQKAIFEKYLSEEERLLYENGNAILAISEAFAEDETANNKYLELQRIAYEKDVAEFKRAQLQKQYDAVNAYKSMQEQIKGLSSGADDIFAKATMSADDYNLWSLQNNRDNAKKSLTDSKTQTEQDIMTSDVFENDDDRYQALLDTYQEYRNGMAAIDVQYHEQVKELAIAQRDTQLAMWSGILSNAQTTLAQLTQSAKDGAGEQSTIYRTMFALQQGFSVASSLVAAYTAYTQAFADPSAMTLPQKFAGAAAVMAALTPALATISSVAIDGMAHDGIDNIPKEGTWLLDKGERVVDSRTNGDLKNFIAENRSHSSSSQVNVNPQIVITDERQSIADFMASRSGEQIIMKTLKRNGIAK